MAYSTDDEQEQSGQPGTDQPGVTNNGSSTLSENASTPVQNNTLGESNGPIYGSGASGKGTSSGQFTNLQSYLNANKDQNPGDQIASAIGQAGSKASSDLSGAQDTFNQEVQNGGVDYGKAQQTVDQALKDPTTYAQDPNNVAEFQKLYNAQYSGPSSLNDVSGFNQQEGQDVTSQLQQAQTEPGRFALLQQQYGNPNYNRGEQSLDQLLMSGNPNTGTEFQSLLNQYGNLGQQYQDALNNAASSAQQEKQGTEQARQYAQNQLGDQQSGIESTVDQQVKNDQNALNSLDTDLGQNKVSQADLALLPGVSAGERVYNVNPLNFFNSGAGPTDQTVITPQQQAQLAALASLSGQQNTFAPGASVAGSYNPTFDQAGFNAAVTAAQNNYNNVLSGNEVLAPTSAWAFVTPHSGGSKAAQDPNAFADNSKQMALPDAINQVKADMANGNYSADLPQLQALLNQYQTQLSNIQGNAGYNNVLSST